MYKACIQPQSCKYKQASMTSLDIMLSSVATVELLLWQWISLAGIIFIYQLSWYLYKWVCWRDCKSWARKLFKASVYITGRTYFPTRCLGHKVILNCPLYMSSLWQLWEGPWSQRLSAHGGYVPSSMGWGRVHSYIYQTCGWPGGRHLFLFTGKSARSCDFILEWIGHSPAIMKAGAPNTWSLWRLETLGQGNRKVFLHAKVGSSWDKGLWGWDLGFVSSSVTN